MNFNRWQLVFAIAAGILVGYFAANTDFVDVVPAATTNNENVADPAPLQLAEVSSAARASVVSNEVASSGQTLHQHMSNEEFDAFVSAKNAEANSTNVKPANVVAHDHDDVGLCRLAVG